MKLNAKRSASHAGQTDQRLDIVRLPPISEQTRSLRRRRKKGDEQSPAESTTNLMTRNRRSQKKPFRVTELQLENRLVENLRNQIYLRLERRFRTSPDDVTGSTERLGANDDVHQYLQTLKSKEDSFLSAYNEVGLRFMTSVSESRPRMIAPLNYKGSTSSSKFVPPFYLALPGLPEASDKAGHDVVLESSRSGVDTQAGARLTGGSTRSRPGSRRIPDGDEDLDVAVSPATSATGCDVEEKEVLGRPEVGLRMKTLEGDFSSSERHRSATIGFYVHSTSETEYERTVLMERVYPRLREYGNRRRIHLEIVDPWWGMEESGMEEHTEQRLLKTTITRCHDDAKRLGRHPYFVTFLTESNSPSGVVPTEIPHREFHSIIQTMSDELERLRNSSIQEQHSPKSSTLPPGELHELQEEPVEVEGEEAEEEEQPERVDTDLVDGEEEEKRDVMSAEVLQERIRTMLCWYQLDENRIPSVYRLKAPSVLFPDVLSRNGRIRWQARKSWSFVGQTLLQTIQDFATKTLIDDKRALQKYFTSSCEIELDHFLDLRQLNNNNDDDDSFDSCIWFRPEVQDPSDLDLISEGVPGDMESTREVSDIADKVIGGGGVSEDPLARKLDNSLSRKVVHTYPLPVGVDGNAARATRTQLPPYVERLTGAFDDAVRDVIDRAAETFPVDELSTLEREIATHLSGCVNRTQSFVGRQRELLAMKKYIRGCSNRPLVVAGKTGSGVTSLISKAAMEAKNWVKRRCITIVRLVGETMESQTVLSLLRSLCLQLSYLQSPEHTEPVPREWNALFNYFQDQLESISQHKAIILFIDSVHELQAPNERSQVVWIPQLLPSNVRLVISTSAEGTNSSLRSLRNWIQSDEKSTDSNFLEVEEFLRSDIAKVTHDWSSKRKDRSVTKTQQRVIEESFDACPSPLYVQLVLEEASRWISSMDEVKLGLTVRGIVLTLLGRLEREYGDVMVRRALGYLALSRHGLTTNELDDLLCLDELVFDEVHALQRPPLRRLPPLMLLRFLDEGRALVREFYSDGYPMKKYAHGLFREIVKERYVKDGRTLRTYHKVMAEYFSGQGTNDGKRDGKGDGKGDGKAAAKPVITDQPLYWEDAEADEASSAQHPSRRVYNVRRLDELPHHLTFSQQTDKLKEFCFCNLDYLLARCECSALGFRQLICDLEIAVNAEQDDLELRLVLKVLRLSALVLDEDPSQLASQFAGRLLQILASDKPVTERDPDRYAYLKTMLRRARDSSTYSSSLVALIPSVACLVPPSGASHYQLLSAHRRPITALATSADGLRAVTASEDNTMRLWDLVTGWTLRKILGVGRDVYEVRLAAPSDKLAVTSEVGLLRIWDLRTSECLHTMRNFKDPAALVIASGGTLLAAVFQGSNYLRVWSLEGRFELIRETVIQEEKTWKPVHKDCTTILSKTCAGPMILYALRDSSSATVYDLKEGKAIRRMKIHDSGSITAVVISRTYGICAARYPETKLLDRVCLEVFDLDTGKQLRSIKSCGWDVIQELNVNAIGSHAVAFCSNKTTGMSCVSTWNIETESHKHVAKHGGARALGAVGDLRFVVTATDDRRNEVRVWNLKESIEAKSAKERPRSGVTRILTMRDHPQYVLAQSTDGRRVDVWNVAMHDLCGSVVHSQPELTAGSDDTLLLHNAVVVILCGREYVKMDATEVVEDDEVLVYRSMKAYDLRSGRWRSEADGLTIPVLPIDDYVLLSEDQLLSPSDNRSQFLVWDVATGNILFQIKIPFREKEPTGDLDEDNPTLTVLGRVGSRRFASSAAMTPWTRRSETRTARGRRHNTEVETARRRRHELQSERHNCIDGFIISGDRSTMVASFNAHHLCVFDLESHKQVGVLRSTSSMMQLTVTDITRDGRSLVTVTYDDDEKEGLVSVWDLPSGTVAHRLSHDGWINAVAVSDDARRVVFCSQTKSPADRNRLCIWQPEVPPPLDLLEIPGHPRFNDGVNAQLRLTRDAARAVVCGAGDISVWDLERSELLCVFSSDSRIQCFDVALNGQLAVIGFQDVASIVTLKLVSGRSQDTSVKVPVMGATCLFGEDPTEETTENGAGEVDEDLSDDKIRINPALFFQSSDDA